MLANQTMDRAWSGEVDTPKLQSPETIRFNRDIRPILSDKCFQCHGPDASQRKGQLRLDTAEGAVKPGASGISAVIPGAPDKSELIQRIVSVDPDDHMPPLKTGKSVTPAELAKLEDWIAGGARFEGHWAFIPPVLPDQPTSSRGSWCKTPIDRFILARLEREKLAPSPEADKVTLIRRLSLDLIGLPPKIEEVDHFLADSRSDSYERLVDRLLESPHYGERWGRIWLDAARYADSDGYEKDKSRKVYFYRDWVVKALNHDLPYDRFIIEQIAGDLLPAATQDQLIATGFLRNSMINEEGGIDPEQFRMEAMFDRMDAIGKSILGITIGCSQCHDHKYDPLTQEDYYRMFALLNNAHEGMVAVYTPEEQVKRAEIFRRIGEIETDLRHSMPDWQHRMDRWEQSVHRDVSPWHVSRTEVDSNLESGEKYYVQEDGSILAEGYAPTLHTIRFTALKSVPTVASIRLELLNDPTLPLGGPGRSFKGLCAVTEFNVDAAPADQPEKKIALKLVGATSDVNPPERELEPIFDDRSNRRRVTGPIEYALDSKDETAWGIDAGPGRRNVPRNAVFVLEKPVTYEAGVLLTFKVTLRHGGWNSDDNQNNNLGRFRFSTADRADVRADRVPRHVRQILDVASDRRTPSQTTAIFSYWRTTVPDWKGHNERIEALWRQHPEGSSQLVLIDRERPRETHLLHRGDFLKPGKVVDGGTPAFLNPISPGKPRNRLTLAQWLVDRSAPTTARSIVNRIWQAYFGTGIVATSEDLGSQCEAPSHPEMLDWLAVDLMDNGWSLKHLHRRIVRSATYRQSSKVGPELLAKDPFNRLLARGARLRIDAELIRDVALASSGLLNTETGGESVYPPAPAFLFMPPASYGPKHWVESTGPQRYRRALYTFRYRSVPYPMLQAFDAPNGDFSCVRRTRSNTPLQALTLLNEPVFLDCARALALATLERKPGLGADPDADRLNFAFRRCLARGPSDAESRVLLDLLHRQTVRFGAGGVNPWDLAVGNPQAALSLPAEATPSQWAGWTAVCRVLLNLDETITKE